MASQSLEQRVQTLEYHVETLKTLPDRVGKLESELRTGFSAIRKSIDELRAQMLMLHEDVARTIRACWTSIWAENRCRAERASKTDPTKNG